MFILQKGREKHGRGNLPSVQQKTVHQCLIHVDNLSRYRGTQAGLYVPKLAPRLIVESRLNTGRALQLPALQPTTLMRNFVLDKVFW